MSIRSLFFEPISRKARAAQLRADGRRNEVAGYPGFAEVCFHTAELLDPTPREKPAEPAKQGRRSRQDRAVSLYDGACTGRMPARNPPRSNLPQHAPNSKAPITVVKSQESSGVHHNRSGVPRSGRGASHLARPANPRQASATASTDGARRGLGASSYVAKQIQR